MLTLLLGTDWTENSRQILDMIKRNVALEIPGQILMVPELISHDTERRLCQSAGDTASRFAEVLTFTRLAKRVSEAVGCGLPECLDNGGRLVAMASVTRQLHSKLKAYAAVETKPEFLTGLLDAVDEFKRCLITPQDLYAASRKSQGSLAQKLEELSLILEGYDSLCARGKRDPRDQMTWLLEQLEDCDFGSEHEFYIDGFPDFTRQHTEIIKHLIKTSNHVVVSLTCDKPDSSEPAFEKASATAVELLAIARETGVSAEIITSSSAMTPVKQLLPVLFQGSAEAQQTFKDCLTASRMESVSQECHLAAEEVISRVENGCRYRDISVVCADMAAYSNTLNMIFSRYGIPVYQSGTEDILEMTVINTALAAVDVVVGGFEHADVLRYLKSSLSPLSIADCDKLENYAIIWNISGNHWFEKWENHPDGLSADWSETATARLTALNQFKDAAIMPLKHLSHDMRAASNVAQMIEALYAFFEEVKLPTRLRMMASQMEFSGDLRNAQVLAQLWEILLCALEQLADMLGETKWDISCFTKLLKLLLSQYKVGTIPATLDAVTVGPVSAMRCQQPKHLIILGANEGSFPAYSGTIGVLTDQERDALRQLGVPLTGGAMEGLQAEFAEIYGVFSGASETVSISCSGDQPAFLYRRLRDLSGSENRCAPCGIPSGNMQEIAAYLARGNNSECAKKLGVEEAYRDLLQQNHQPFAAISAESVNKLYGQKLNFSASQVDKLADCRLAYFLKYGLRLKERKAATVDPAEFGTYVHAVLEQTGCKIMELGGFHDVPLEETLQIANDYSVEYISRHFSQIDSQRMSYLFQRNTQELEMVVAELWQELKDAAFEPVAFELAFGANEDVDAVSIHGSTMDAELRGFVDRVDLWRENGQNYCRVVDYKTGRKDFDYCDVFNGLGLQMLLYLFALEDHGEKLLGGHLTGAGVQYFPARAPIVSVEGRPDEDEALTAREKIWKRKGLLLADEEVLHAMEPSDKPKRLSYSTKKDGSISGDLADRNQMQLLKRYVFSLLGKMVDDIASGRVAANPYTRGSRHNACAFCPFEAICREEAECGRRNYAAMSAQQFWDEIEKEMKHSG